MNFLSRMKFKNNPNQIVRLAMENYDRPTELKESLIKLNIDFQEAQDLVLDAEKILSKHPAVANDVRLAFLEHIVRMTHQDMLRLSLHFLSYYQILEQSNPWNFTKTGR